jgi:hypothetical protein
LALRERYTFSDPPELTNSVFIEHLRNALSQPTCPEKSSRYPSTGYTTMPDGTGIISRLCFIDSPWVQRGEILSNYCGNSEEKVRRTAGDFREPRYGKLEARQNSKGEYQIFREDEPYLPIFEAELSIGP